jgi:hypothetical protein
MEIDNDYLTAVAPDAMSNELAALKIDDSKQAATVKVEVAKTDDQRWFECHTKKTVGTQLSVFSHNKREKYIIRLSQRSSPRN